MKKILLTLLFIALLVVPDASGQRRRKKRPKPKPAPTQPSPKPIPDSPAIKGLGNCSNANFNARCSAVLPDCVQGNPNEGCLDEGDNCTNCYRGSPTPQPKPKLQPAKNDWPDSIVGPHKEGVGWVISDPGGWKKKGLRAGDIITKLGDVDIKSEKAFKDAVVKLYLFKTYVAVQVREVAVK